MEEEEDEEVEEEKEEDEGKVEYFIQGGFFDCSALKMTKCQPLKEISELFLPKNN